MKTGLLWSLILKNQKTGLLVQSFPVLVFSSLGPVWLQSFCSLETGLTNTTRHILEQSYGQLKHSSMQQTMMEGYAQPLEHQNVPPLYTFTHTPNHFWSLIFGFRKSKSLWIWPLVFQLHAATHLILPSHILLFQIVRLHAVGKILTNCHQFCLPSKIIWSLQWLPVDCFML